MQLSHGTYSAADLATAVDGRIVAGSPEARLGAVAIDSRALDAGELFTEATQLPQAPAAPALSAEATRLLEASEEELDAELLAIFLEEAEDVRDTIAKRLAELVRNPHDVEVLTTIKILFCVVPVVLYAGMFIMLSFYKLTDARVEAISQQLIKHRAAQGDAVPDAATAASH